MTKLFGTNGIRGVVNDDMNCELALGIGTAWGTYLRKNIKKPKVAIGTDARLSNYMLKNAITAGFLATGCDIVDIGLVPTPTLQYTVHKKDFDSGVIITASHNPPQFNGIKGVDEYGTEYYKDTEEAIEKIYFEKKYSYVKWNDVGRLTYWDKSIDLYIKGILSNVDKKIIKKKQFNVVLDCGNGSGGEVTPILLKKLGCKITKLYCNPDGTFPGHNSEPIPENLHELMNLVTEVGADFGVAQDGDADRAIFIDENGTYQWGDKTLSLVAKYITKQNNGGVAVTPISTSSCFEDVVKANNGRVIYTKVGSPTVARVMIENNAVFGGEENGGLIFPDMQYCRDSAMSIAKILEILAKENKSLSDLIREIPKYDVFKIKMSCPNNMKESVINTLIEKIKSDISVIKVDKTDGLKIYVKDGWILMRPSGTEPIFRVYSESKSKEKAEKLAIFYKSIIDKIIK